MSTRSKQIAKVAARSGVTLKVFLACLEGYEHTTILRVRSTLATAQKDVENEIALGNKDHSWGLVIEAPVDSSLPYYRYENKGGFKTYQLSKRTNEWEIV